MFGPDYIILALAIAMLATIPMVIAWPAKQYDALPESSADSGSKRKLPSTILYPGPKEETRP